MLLAAWFQARSVQTGVNSLVGEFKTQVLTLNAGSGSMDSASEALLSSTNRQGSCH